MDDVLVHKKLLSQFRPVFKVNLRVAQPDIPKQVRTEQIKGHLDQLEAELHAGADGVIVYESGSKNERPRKQHPQPPRQSAHLSIPEVSAIQCLLEPGHLQVRFRGFEALLEEGLYQRPASASNCIFGEQYWRLFEQVEYRNL